MKGKKKKQKEKYNRLYAPTTFQRVWKVYAYNIFWSIVFFFIFFRFYSIEQVCYELDYFMFYGFTDLRLELFSTCIAFWFAFRQFFKDCNVIRFTIKMCRHDKDIIEKGGFKRMYEGSEGLGKTLNTAYETLQIACDKDRDLRLRYFLDYPFKEQLKDDVDFKVLEESFEYYEKNTDKIPHLMANFKVGYKGKREYPFTMDYFDKKKRPAEGFACGITEVGNLLPNNQSRIAKDEKKDVFNAKTKQEILSLSRQYFNMHIVSDEQRTAEVFLPFRAVLSSNVKLIERRKVLKPFFLMNIQSFLENRIIKSGKKNKKWRSRLYRKLTNIIQDIGFYVFIYEDRDGETSHTKKEDLEFVISCDIPFEFDTRGERNKYALYSRSPE